MSWRLLDSWILLFPVSDVLLVDAKSNSSLPIATKAISFRDGMKLEGIGERLPSAGCHDEKIF